MMNPVSEKSIVDAAWRILIIDDDEDDFLITREMLREAKGRKFDVEWVSTYEAGRSELNADHYDAVLVDYDLGLHSGIELIREANERGYASPLILFTGRGNYEVDVEAMQAGATLYLTKGEVNALLLERVIRYAIERKQTEAELRAGEAKLRASNEALHESEARWREFLESTHDNFIALDRDWCFTYANRHYGDVMGMEPQALIGKNYWELFPQYRGTALEKNYRQVMDGGAPLHYRQGGVYTKNLYDVSVYPTQEGLAIFSTDRTEELRYQQQLENEHARLEAVLEAMPVAVWIADQTGRVVFKNAQADQIWGGDAPLSDSIDGYQEYVAWFMDSGKPVAAAEFPVAQALKTGRPGQPAELRIRRFDGTEGAVLAIGAPIKDRGDQLMGAVAINVDITERQRAEQAMRESESKYQAVFESAPFSIILARLSDGVIIDVNTAWQNLFEVSKEEATGRTSLELGTAPDQATRERGYAEMREHGRLRNFEMRFRTKTGKDFISSNNASVVEINGVRYLLSVTEDITEQKKAEESLRKLSRAVEFSPASVVITDTSGTIEYVNPTFTALTGYSLEEAIGKNPRILKSGLTPDTVYREMWGALKSGGLWQGELCNRKKNGELYWESALISPISDEGGTVTHFVAVKLDITDRKQAEKDLQHYAQELERSNQALQDFAFIASHDLQEPLRKVLMFGDILKRHLSSEPDAAAADYLERMQNAAGRMQAMINGLLELSRVNTRGSEFTQVDLNQVVAEVVSDLEARIKAVAGQVQVGPLPTVEADALQMHQLFQNLVGNAIKFHKPDVPPIVRVSAAVIQPAPSQGVEIRVEDNGIGFEQEYTERIFQPFQRLHSRNEYEGTGLGLSICQKIAERHHGQITAQSQPGQGTTFIITLQK